MGDDVTTIGDLGVPQFGCIDSGHRGEEMLGPSAEGMLSVSAGRVNMAVEERETIEVSCASIGHRLAMMELANDPRLSGMAMPPNPRYGRGGLGYGGGRGGGAGSRGAGGRGRSA